MKATYLYQHYNYNTGQVERISIPVEIIKETPKSYQVKLLAPNVNGHMWGDIIWVQKKSITLPPEAREPRYDYTDAWWQN